MRDPLPTWKLCLVGIGLGLGAGIYNLYRGEWLTGVWALASAGWASVALSLARRKVRWQS